MITKSEFCEKIRISKTTLRRKMKGLFSRQTKHLKKCKLLSPEDTEYILKKLGYEENLAKEITYDLFNIQKRKQAKD